MKVEDGQAFVRFNSKWAPLYNTEANLYKMGRRNITFAFGETTYINNEGGIVELKKLTDKPTSLDGYTGTYYSEETNGTFTVREEEGVLLLSTPSLKNEPLFLVEGETFCYGSMTSNFKKIRFNRDAHGAIESLDYIAPQITGLNFKKR